MGQASPAEATIEIDPRLPPRDYLGTLIHEALHCVFPELSESAVVKAERRITRLLWRANYRRVDQ